MEYTFEIFANGELSYINKLSFEDLEKIVDFANGIQENKILY